MQDKNGPVKRFNIKPGREGGVVMTFNIQRQEYIPK